MEGCVGVVWRVMLGLYRRLCWGSREGCVGVMCRVVLGMYGGLCWVGWRVVFGL